MISQEMMILRRIKLTRGELKSWGKSQNKTVTEYVFWENQGQRATEADNTDKNGLKHASVTHTANLSKTKRPLRQTSKKAYSDLCASSWKTHSVPVTFLQEYLSLLLLLLPA